MEKILKKSHWLKFFVLVTSFFVFYYYFMKNNAESITNNFLNASAIAGFITMIFEYIVNLFENYHDNKVYSVIYICKRSSFSIKYYQDLQNNFSNKMNIKFFTKIFQIDDAKYENLVDFLNKEGKKYDVLIIRLFDINEIKNLKLVNVMRKLHQKKIYRQYRYIYI